MATRLLFAALEAIHSRTNVETGWAHPNDRNVAKELFLHLHNAGEILDASEIEAWAVMNEWQPRDAKALGQLGAEIGVGKKLVISGGPWWKPEIIDNLRKQKSRG